MKAALSFNNEIARGSFVRERGGVLEASKREKCEVQQTREVGTDDLVCMPSKNGKL